MRMKDILKLTVYKKGIDANLDNDENGNDFNVLAPPTVRRDQDVLNAIKNGQYNVRVCTINLQTQEHNWK